MMNVSLITREYLECFKKEIIAEIQALKQQPQQNDWLRSADVRKMLGISAGTLQTLRISGELPYSRMGKTIVYSRKAIEKMLQKNMKNKID